MVHEVSEDGSFAVSIQSRLGDSQTVHEMKATPNARRRDNPVALKIKAASSTTSINEKMSSDESSASSPESGRTYRAGPRLS